MKLYSTNNKNLKVNLADAVMMGLAPDGGLFMPQKFPKITKKTIMEMYSMEFKDIAQVVACALFEDDLKKKVIDRIVDESFNFKLPLVKIEEGVYAAELFHGPTLAFKDFAARFMARLMGYYAKKRNKKLTILVATSGDTGSAVADGFLGVNNINVIILYPSGKVSPLQEKQLTAMGNNITALEIKGSFDDCQALVKKAFLDDDIKKTKNLASANSINIARLLPQSFYYFYFCARFLKQDKKIAIAVPCGNFGNLTAGLIAKRMGAPIDMFVAATNKNNVVPRYLKSGKFAPRPSLHTISNAMDVGNPSNFARMLELYPNQKQMKKDIFGVSFSDEATKKAIKKVYLEHHHLMDPHGAVAYLGLKEFLGRYPKYAGVFLETAHPAKFSEIVEEVIGKKIEIPKRLAQYATRPKRAILMENDFNKLKEFLLSFQFKDLKNFNNLL